MIKPSIITYEVSSSELNFRKVFDNKDLAEKVDNNLTKTSKFLDVLKKYYKLPDSNSKSNDYERSTSARFLISEHGQFNGISIYHSSTHYDNWDGRPPISNSSIEEVSREKFFNKQLKDVVNTINKHIEACEYLSPNRGVTAMLPESIFNLAKTEIAKYKSDLEVLKSYTETVQNFN